ncbi:MAG: prolyl oligopeptidase family serine peptidase [Vicinamibacterales bacterium]
MRRLAALLVFGSVLVVGLVAQSKPTLTRADYGQWESLGFFGARAFSPDGAWVAYAINRSSRENELRLKRLSDGLEKTVPGGGTATFSSDSAWAAFTIGYSETELERRREARESTQNRLGLVRLSSGEMTEVDGIQSFAFSGDGRYVAMRRYAPTANGATAPAGGGRGGGRGGGGGNAGGDGDTPPVGVTVIVRALDTGRDTTFGNVSDFAWQDAKDGHLLAMTISADGRSGNGVHVFDPATTVLRVLDSADADYSSLSWREDSADLVLFRSRTDDTHDGPTQLALAWRGLGTGTERAITLDPASAGGFPAGKRTVTWRRPSWSEDGTVIFLGIADWATRPAPARGRGARGRGAAGASGDEAGTTGGDPQAAGARGRGRGAPAADEPADVDVWHWKDTVVMSRQKNTAAADRRRNLLSAWHLDTGRFVQLAQTFEESVSPIPHRAAALVDDWSRYAMARSIGRGASDLSVVDLATGQRTALRGNVGSRAQVSPGGRYVLFSEGGHYFTIDLDTKAVTNITSKLRTAFQDVASDSTAPAKPMFGVAGWTPGDATVLLYDEHDVWQVDPHGASGIRLTNGTADDVRHRLVRVDTSAETIAGAQFASLFGIHSKQSGYARLTVSPTMPSAPPAVDRLVWQDAAVSSLAKADAAEVYGYVVQDHDDSPDLFVGDASLAGARQVTTTNPFQATYAWSHSEVVDYKSTKGLPLQGALYYPANYEPGRKYPMIVYVYETLSDGVHRYVAPSDRDYYNTTVFTQHGYFVLQPDIVFRPREPGLSVVECVTPAVKKVVDMGLADAGKVGVVGHSWGGFDTAFLATHTQGVFAAAVAGAAITDLVSNYGNHHWSSGIAETDHIETGQQRMVVPLYEDLDAYIRNSALYDIAGMTTPLLLEAGDDDGTVFWHQAVSMYNIARRAQKNVVMIVYANEDHGLRQKKNQVDYQQKILAWFGHYLKGDPAPAWITDGLSYLDRQAEIRAGGGGR